jgi:hypothetical protein
VTFKERLRRRLGENSQRDRRRIRKVKRGNSGTKHFQW